MIKPPGVEVFIVDQTHTDPDLFPEAGWYWWPCFAGCIPDSDPFGPFDTRDEAIQDATKGYATEEFDDVTGVGCAP